MASETPSEFATSEIPVSDLERDATPETPVAMASFPPYPPYATEPAPPSVADTIIAGRGLRLQHKSVVKKPVRPPPKPAKPRGPKATDVKMTRRALRAHARCLRKHGAILTDRLEHISKPRRRNVIYLWREHAHTLPPETIARLRSMLDADEPFKPDQAYEYFVNLRKTKKRNTANERINAIKKDVLAMCAEKKFLWARNATVAFARGIQQRLSRPGRYALADGMLRLSNIILDDICGYMRMKTPSRRCTHPKAKFMMEMSDKVAVWIDEILSESDDRMLMMDFDEDEEEVEKFNDDALRPEGESPETETPTESLVAAPTPASTTVEPTLASTTIEPTPASAEVTPTPTSATVTPTPASPLTSPAVSNGAIPAEGSPPTSPSATPGTTPKASDILGLDGPGLGGDGTFEDDFLNMMGDGGLMSGPHPDYLKFRGKMKEAFQVLTDTMNKKGNANLLTHNKFTQTYREGADALKRAPDLGATEYNTAVALDINMKLNAATKDVTPPKLGRAMKDMVDICSNFLAQHAEFNKDKGPAFKLLMEKMRTKPNDKLYQKDKVQHTYGEAATQLEQAQGLETDHDDPNLSQEIHSAMTNLVDKSTPGNLKKDMAETVDTCSKYLSQKAVDEIERTPAFDLLVKELNNDGGDYFSEFPALSTKHAAAYTLMSAPGLSSVSPDPSTAPEFKDALHKAADAATPKNMEKDMDAVVDRCGNYLSAFVRDRDAAMQALLEMMKKKPNNEFAARNNYTMDYETGAQETENAPTLVPFLHVKDIADEGKANLTKDMEGVTAPDMKIPMKAMIQDVSRYLSQPVAMRSGAAGTRYPMNFLAAVKKSLGTRPLFKYRAYGQTYADAADVLQHAGPIESQLSLASQQNLALSRINLGHEIASEMKRGVPTQLAPTIAEGLNPTMAKAAKHLAKVGSGKGKALEYIVHLMKDKGESLLGHLQGYQQSYGDGAIRIENAPSLANDKVDKGAYETVKGKLTAMTTEKPDEKFAEQLPEMLDESSKYLSSPIPETGLEKRRVLADLMGRKEDKILGEEGIYKVTYAEGGREIMKAPVGVTEAYDEAKKKDMIENVRAVIPDKKMMELLKDPTQEGAAHLTDIIKGRGQALGIIHEGLKKEKEKEFVDVGIFKKTHEQAADILTDAPYFGGQTKPSPVIMDKVVHQVSLLEKDVPPESTMAKAHMEDASKIASKYIAAVATKDSGLDSEALAALDAAGFNADSEAAAEARRLAALKARMGIGAEGVDGVGHGSETEKQHRRRSGEVEAHKREEEEKKRKGEAEKRSEGEGEKRRKGEGEKKKEGDEDNRRIGEEDNRRKVEEENRRKVEEENRRKVEEENGRKIEEEKRRKREEEEKKRLEEKDYLRQEPEKSKRGGKYRGGALGADYDPEHEAALDILHKELRSHGPEMFYQQPQTSLTHGQASDWLAMPTPLRVDKTVKESGDTARLHKKFERKLNVVTNKVTPPSLTDSMQDVVIESARRLSELFVSTNYKALVREALISEMQKRGNEILTEVDGAAETFFFAAQRLKKSKAMNVEKPCYQVAYHLTKKLEDMIRCRSMARKLTGTMKDHIKDAADYLSGLVTKPDEKIEAYIALLGEMEAAGDSLLIEGAIPKSHKDAVAYLRQLTSFEDQIGRSDPRLQKEIQDKLKSLVSNVPPSGYSQTVMDSVIAESAGLLVSHIMLQGDKTEALKVMVQAMEQEGDSVLLRHGPIRKSYKEGADTLRGKNTGQLSVPNADPVVVRKIQIKLNNLMHCHTPQKYQALMDDVVEDATMYLATHFLQPQSIQVCKCMKSVFVQCELWCDEILRRVTRPCCMCSRHVSAQALQDLAPVHRFSISPGGSHMFAPGLEISVTTCPNAEQQEKLRESEKFEPRKECPAPKPSPACQDPTTSYLLYSTSYNKIGYNPMRQSSSSSSDSPDSHLSQSSLQLKKRSSPFQSLLHDIYPDKIQLLQQQQEQLQSFKAEKHKVRKDKSPSFHTPDISLLSGTSQGTTSDNPSQRHQTPMYANIETPETPKITQTKSAYSSRTPIISTDQMADWHAMMVSLMWNVQAWRDWIQENIDRALAYHHNPNVAREIMEDSWSTFQRRVSTEALQWRQYSTFTRRLTLRLAHRYEDKEIVSPVRATSKTKTYSECQQEMIEIIDVFNRWTQWLTLIVKETDSMEQVTGSDIPLHEMRWNHLKKKIEEYSKDWEKYNVHLKVSWMQKYSTIMADYLPSWKQPGPVWVVGACGAVPSGAVAAGVYDGEVIWVARTTHRCNVLPAALYPSKHCCLVYADGAVHPYTKYQVMCNAEVRWVAWRGGSIGGRAVRVAPGVHVGRVHYRGEHLLGAVHEPHYRCHVVIFGRPFAFNCYELLMLADNEDQ